MFFDSWADLWRVLVAGTTAYVALIIFLRISGKRTLSKMNAFDLVITIAFGSVLASTILSDSVSISEGILALGLLVFMQYCVTWLTVRSELVSSLVKADPRLLYHRGRYLRRAMKQERINREEILQAMRNQGLASPEDAEAVVLETDGSLTVVTSEVKATKGTLDNVFGPKRRQS